MTTSPTPETRPPLAVGDADALSAGLGSLAGLVIRDDALPATLTHIAHFAAHAIPGADGAGLTLFQNGRPDTVVSSAPFVRETDELQYGIGEGPCITATREGRTVSSRSLGDDQSFPTFGPLAAQLGVHSSLSLPLVAGRQVLGSINVYAHAKDAFDEHATRLGELFAVPAGVTVQNAQALSQTQRLAARLGETLQRRARDTAALGLPFSTERVAYEVAWSIEVEAYSAEEAADVALQVLADEGGTARVFQVTHTLADQRPTHSDPTTVTETIDLAPEPVDPPEDDPAPPPGPGS